MGKHINQAKKPVSVLVTILLALSGIVGFTQLANAAPMPEPELCVASQDEADFTAMISDTVPGLVEIESTEDLVRWSLSYDVFRDSDVVIRASELVLECVFPAIPMFRGTLNAAYENDETSISVIRFEGGITASVDRGEGVGLGMFSELDGASVYNLQIEGSIYTDESVVGSLAGVASGTTVSNATVSDMTLRIDNPGSSSECRNPWINNMSLDQTGCIGGLIGVGHDVTLDTVRGSGNISVDVSREKDSKLDNIGGIAGVLYSDEPTDLISIHSDFNLSLASTGEVDYVGGLVGLSERSDFNSERGEFEVSASSNRGSISVAGLGGPSRVGGLFGEVDHATELNASYNSGAVTVSSNGADTVVGLVGGLIGDPGDVTISQSYNLGAIIVTSLGSGFSSLNNVGGLVGDSGDTVILDSYNSGDISVLSTYDSSEIGGLIGESVGIAEITESDNFGSVSVSAGGEASGIGGILGATDDDSLSISSSTNTRPITITGTSASNVGGLVGYLLEGTNEITNSHNSGSITITSSGDTSRIGGVLGYADEDNEVTLLFTNNSGSITISSSGDTKRIGGLVGLSDDGGQISFLSSDNSGSVTITSTGSTAQVGGLLGDANDGREDSLVSGENSGPITISSGIDTRYIGGLLGQIEQDLFVSESLNSGPVSIWSGSEVGYVGGLIGNSGNTSIISSSNTRALTVTAVSNRVEYVGGLAGYVGDLDVDSSSNSGQLNVSSGADASKIGGLVSVAEETSISESFNSGTIAISAVGFIKAVGGLYAYTDGALTIDESYSVGSFDLVSAISVTSIGGLVGDAVGSGSVEISSSFSQVSGLSGTDKVGGLIGDSGASNVQVEQSYISSVVSSDGDRGAVVGYSTQEYGLSGFVWRYDNDESSDTPDVTELVGNGSAVFSSANAYRASSALMRTQSTFTDLGWDFESIWEMSGTDSWLCFPVLQWQEVTPDSSCDEAPARSLSVSRTTFTEAVANDGSITLTSVLTLTGDTFSGDNNRALGSVTNVPAGLTASLVKTSDTTATLSFTGSATAHANAQDISNLTVTFLDGDFTGGNASGVSGFTTSNLVIDFADASSPPPGGGSSSPITITPPAAGLTEAVSAMVPGFAPNSSRMTSSMRISLRALVAANPAATSVRCRGFTSAPSTPQDLRLSRDRGKAICDFIVRLNPAINAKVLRGEHDNRSGQQVRRVRVVLR